MISPARNFHGWFSIISRSVPRFFPLKPPFRWDFPTEHPGCPSRRKTIWSPPSWTGCFNESHGIFIKSRSGPRIPREGGTHGGFSDGFSRFWDGSWKTSHSEVSMSIQWLVSKFTWIFRWSWAPAEAPKQDATGAEKLLQASQSLTLTWMIWSLGSKESP